MQITRALYYNLAQGSGQQSTLPPLTIGPGGTVQVPLDLGSIGLGASVAKLWKPYLEDLIHLGLPDPDGHGIRSTVQGGGMFPPCQY